MSIRNERAPNSAVVGPLSLVRIAPPGQSTQTALFIRDTTARISRFGRTPGIAGRFRGLDWREQVLVVAILLKIRTSDEPVYYDLWFDLRADDRSSVPFVDLAVQPNTMFQFFGDNDVTMTACMIKNPFRDFARNVLRTLEQYPRWNQDAFRCASEELRGRHPTLPHLWEALGSTGPSGPLIIPQSL